jgi:hypothetical protein
MSKKPSFTPSKIIPEIEPNHYIKWIPLLCAGAAAGISIIALKEIKNVKNEIIALKAKGPDNSDLSKKMESFEVQLKTITDYLKSKSEIKNNFIPKVSGDVIKNVVKENIVKIINEVKVEPGLEDEYEEIEVTDDETDE